MWIGDPAEIKAKRAKKQKTDRQDAQLLLKLSRRGIYRRVMRDLQQKMRRGLHGT
jgi:hypothetical protein